MTTHLVLLVVLLLLLLLGHERQLLLFRLFGGHRSSRLAAPRMEKERRRGEANEGRERTPKRALEFVRGPRLDSLTRPAAAVVAMRMSVQVEDPRRVPRERSRFVIVLHLQTSDRSFSLSRLLCFRWHCGVSPLGEQSEEVDVLEGQAEGEFAWGGIVR